MQNNSILKAGIDFIGVGVGALIVNNEGKIFLAKRGPKCKNERGKFEIPGGAVKFNETLQDALIRETREEYDIDIEIISLLNIPNHIMLDEKQHWISPTYICRIKNGTPKINEPDKCTEFGWYSLEQAKNLPLSLIVSQDIEFIENNNIKLDGILK